MTVKTMVSTESTEVRPLVADPLVRDLSSSCKLVWVALDSNEAATQKAIVEETGLCSRTARTVLDRLIEEEIVQKEIHPGDARQSLYSLID